MNLTGGRRPTGLHCQAMPISSAGFAELVAAKRFVRRWQPAISRMWVPTSCVRRSTSRSGEHSCGSIPISPTVSILPELEDPDLPEGEVEIARLYLASGIGNTISVRATKRGTDIALRAVDEFEDRLSIKPGDLKQPSARMAGPAGAVLCAGRQPGVLRCRAPRTCGNAKRY